MSEKEFLREMGELSVKSLRGHLLEEGLSPEFFQKFDEITEKTKQLEFQLRENVQKKMRASDANDIAHYNEEARRVGLEMSDLKMQLEELLLEEEIKVDGLKKYE